MEFPEPKVFIKNDKIRIDPIIEKKLRNAQYGVWGHSTVEICHWTKKALRGEGVCYKRKFFGIETHRCMEFSPTGAFCSNRCIYCWRPAEFYRLLKMDEKMVDDPKEIVEHLLEERRKLLSGFGGNEKVDKEIFEESLVPSHYAISLSGEPTMYPKLPELIKYLKSLPTTKSIFLVTNGQYPEMLERLEKEDALPTQIYLSMNAGTIETFKKVNRPLFKDFWERYQKSLEFISKTKTRTVIRITLIKGFNDLEKELPEFAKLIKKANPHFVEVKAYMHIGYSIYRLKRENMPEHEYVKAWAEKLLQYLPDFRYMDEHKDSRIVILQNQKRYVDRWILKPEESTYYEKYQM